MHWTIVFDDGFGIAWLKRFGKRLVPIEKIRSLLFRNVFARLPRAPSDSGWLSGKALFAFSVVRTGTWASSANCRSSSVASAYSTPSPA